MKCANNSVECKDMHFLLWTSSLSFTKTESFNFSIMESKEEFVDEKEETKEQNNQQNKPKTNDNKQKSDNIQSRLQDTQQQLTRKYRLFTAAFASIAILLLVKHIYKSMNIPKTEPL